MSLQSGKELLHYRLVEQIGEGGMGVVWKAQDTQLGRDVAIKILPIEMSRDPERLARFEREAKLLASLNHPNIAAIYGLHQVDSPEGVRHFLAMELVEGEDLAKRLERGPLSVESTLKVGAQIAAGVEAAHENGVIHRDLKPANVIVASDGRVRILDFGLAKAFEADPVSASGSLSMSPTLTSAGTVAGMILGTAAYMSPEQARGKPLDRRTDIWSFGCMLYECFTGERLFAGETVSDSLAAILRKEPSWDALPDDTPPMVRLMLKRCLVRDAARRLRDVGDARIELEDASDDPGLEALELASAQAAASDTSHAPRFPPGAVVALAAIAAVLAIVGFATLGGGQSADRVARPTHLAIPISGLSDLADNVSAPPVVSPDGRFVAYGMADERGINGLWLRPMDSFDGRVIPGTEDAPFAFWSPDSKHLGFYQDGRLKRVEVASGRIQTVGVEGAIVPRGASWTDNDQILFAPNANTGIWVIDAAGGEPRQITTPDESIPDASHRWPCALPDEELFLFVLWSNDIESLEKHGGIYLASLSGDQEPVRISSDASSVAYAPSGHLLGMVDKNLVALPLDLSGRRIRGEAKIIADGVSYDTNNARADFSISHEGTLVFARDTERTSTATLVWADRTGGTSATPVEATRMFDVLRLSPDATRAVTTMPGVSGDPEVWVIDLLRGVRTRLVEPASWSYFFPIWSLDGDRVMYASTEKGSWDLYTRQVDGSGVQQPFMMSTGDKLAYEWLEDRLLYYELPAGGTAAEHRVYNKKTEQSELLLTSPLEIHARASPEGRYFTYFVSEAGRREVFVQAVEGGARWQVSTNGGSFPKWSDDGREIVYVDSDRRMMAVPVEVHAESVSLGRAEELFQLDRTVFAWDITGDHRRFLFATRPETASQPFRVILNWDEGL